MSPVNNRSIDLNGQPEDDEEPSPDEYIRPNKRKRRECLNCAECRRLKLRCDRKVPCSNCVQRSCSDLCPEGTRAKRQSSVAARAMSNPTTETTSQARLTPRLPDTVPPGPDLQSDQLEADYSSLPGASNFDDTSPAVGILPTSAVSMSSPLDDSHGTLLITQSGRSKYLGPTAASEWLRAQQAFVSSRAPSPVRSRRNSPILQTFESFPVAENINLVGSIDLVKFLPSEDDARAIVELYHRHFGWSYDLVPRESSDHLLATFNPLFAVEPKQEAERNDWFQELGLFFAMLAIGTAHNLEIPPDDPLADAYMQYTRHCLVNGKFMAHNSLAGVQALCLLAHYLLDTDQGKDGEASWPLWGLAMRIGLAMGLHRDGANWRLSNSVVEDRRRVFWECHSAEIFQANCFSRPPCIAPDFVDTHTPAHATPYHQLKFELSRLSSQVLYASLSVSGASYTKACELYDTICGFEAIIPIELRCRASMQSLPSAYPSVEIAQAHSHAPERRQFRQTFQQHQLALLTCETIVNLFRPFFLRAIAENPRYPVATECGRAFLSVIERCFAMIQIVQSLYDLHSKVISRHWWCWCHAFNSAVCVGTFLLISPNNELASMVLSNFDQVMALYSSVVLDRPTARLAQNLKWLVRLRQRITARMAVDNPIESPQDTDSELESGLLGWKTRLISMSKRARQDKDQRVLTGPEVNDLIGAHAEGEQALQDNGVDNSFLHDYWMPALQSNTGIHAADQTWNLNWLDWLEAEQL